MLPLSLLNAAQGKPMLVELKNGETYNGHMIACDNFMNITLRDVILTAPDGDKFYQMKEVYLKGNVIKYVRVADQILDKVQEEQQRIREQNRQSGGAGRGGRGGMGNARGGAGGGFNRGKFDACLASDTT
ncbi:hypothetical protein NliqN6_2334 [Naganishia liquefaciens]|uniref:LSM complex subunit LSM4 n=1 Tax=Naganishia liquefaciens TaxID=104408 RepID=A0A8H3YF65_9TREE|nr:hypothetical protein NliqN6_2334 [Naganishia liquefaciens]